MAYLTSLVGKISDTVSRIARLDAITHALQVITYAHHEIHAGNHYNYNDYVLGVDVNEPQEFVFTAPSQAGKWAHLEWLVFSGKGATIELFAGTTGVTGGTPVAIRNNNGNSANTSDSAIVLNPTSIANDGTRVAGYLAGGGDKNAGTSSREQEDILIEGLSYLVRITSLENDNDISWSANWYEHVNKD